MKAWLLAILLTAGALAGCASTGDGAGDGDGAAWTDGLPPQRYALPEDPMPEGPGHDHTDPAQHRFLWNYEFSDRDPLLQNAANVAGVHALDVQAGHLFAAVYGSHSVAVDGGLVIWDLSDPAHPRQTGRWTIPGSVGGDRSMEATPDGDYVVIATEPVDCAGHVNPSGAPVSAYLIDTRDKSRPIVSDVLTATGRTVGDVMSGGEGLGGPSLSQHSVAVHRIQDVDYAFIAGKIYRIDRAEAGAKLVYVNTVGTGHDLYVRDTPWGTTWAITANGGGGMVVWDVTVPEQSFQVATWDLPDRKELEAAGTAYYFHTADVSFLPDGNVVFVLTSEDWGETVSPLWVLDGNPLKGITEEPAETAQLEVLGEWRNPGNHPALAGLTFSLHNPRFHDDGILTLSSYHGGMWQLDLRVPEFWEKPAEIAYAAYAEGSPTATSDPIESAVQKNLCGLEIALDAPSYWDVEVGPNGILYLADGFLGLYTFVPTDDHPVFGASRVRDFNGTAGT